MNASNKRVAPSAARRRVAFLGLGGGALTAAVALFATGPVGATPGAGIVGGPIVARGVTAQEIVLGVPKTLTVTRPVTIRVGGKTVRKRISYQSATVERLLSCGAAVACDVAFQHLTIAPGGHTGWHNHPGPTFVAIVQGEGTLYRAVTGCPANKYGPNSGFFQPSSEIHNFRNEGSTALVVYAFYALPPGTANTAIRTDQPQPTGCANIP
jgi:mannose-6-phosphate isomerase-like protein (cupin superfamily)